MNSWGGIYFSNEIDIAAFGEEQYLIKNFLLCLGDAIDIISVD